MESGQLPNEATGDNRVQMNAMSAHATPVNMSLTEHARAIRAALILASFHIRQLDQNMKPAHAVSSISCTGSQHKRMCKLEAVSCVSSKSALPPKSLLDGALDVQFDGRVALGAHILCV